MCDFGGMIKNPASSIAPIGTLMSGIGTLVSADTSIKSGKAQRTAAQFTASQLDQNANAAMATGQRLSADERLKAELLASRAIAVAGASGGDVTSPSVSKLIADISGRGAYNAGVVLYDAEERARKMSLGAQTTRYEGELAADGGYSKAGAQLFGGAASLAKSASLFGKYGRGGPKPKDAGAEEWYPTDTGNP